eukprot:Hpha_TRINITY_DN9128_c0_g1::TRINITY_DN9128_c0_g1_i1::g.94239::m.94239
MKYNMPERSRLTRCWFSCSDWFIKESDSPEDVRVKRGLTPVFIYIVLFCSAIVIQRVFADFNWSFVGGIGLSLLSALQGLVGGILGARMTNCVDTFVLGFAIASVLIDAYTAADARDRCWPLLVLILDTSIVYHTDRFIPVVLGITLAWLLLERTESVVRFGLYEVVSSKTPLVCDCATPPCALRVFQVTNYTGMYILVLLGDYFLTRSFSLGLRQQLRRVEASVKVAGEIASALAMYDVEVAEGAIARGGNDLPSELGDSFKHLLSNLRAYRDYLPELLLRRDNNPASAGSVPPPRAPGGQAVDVGVVFTEIESCAELWAQYPHDMHQALRTHNSVLRGLAKEHYGYEVKLIGDSLMLAFHSAANAVVFGVEAQLRLVQSEWPSALTSHPLCAQVQSPEGGLLWNGVRVGIGIHWGSAQPEQNPVTGRYDFLGSTVNTASEVLAELSHGGLIGITQAVVDEAGLLPPGLGYESANGQVFRLCDMKTYMAPLGEKELRGVEEPVFMHLVLPWSLIMRRELVSPLEGKVCPTERSIDDEPSRFFFSDFTAFAPRAPIPPPSPLSACSPLRSPSSSSASVRRTPRTSLGLGVVAMGTCATVRGEFREVQAVELDKAVSKMLVEVENAAMRTEGQVVCVVSAVCVLGWNVGTWCHDHIAQSAHFLGVIRLGQSVKTYSGAATGRILSGNISGARMRYATVVGTCIELSLALADFAALHSLTFVATGEVGAHLAKEGLAQQCGRWAEVQGEESVVWGRAGPDEGGALEEGKKRKFIKDLRKYVASFNL